MNSKQKGNRFERECAAILRAELWRECYTSRFMGSAWDDYLGIDLAGTGNYNIQCKHIERSMPYHTILKNMPQGSKTNLVLHKRNNEGIVVAMMLEDFIKILRGRKKGKNEKLLSVNFRKDFRKHGCH